MIILKVTKNQGFTHSLEGEGGRGGGGKGVEIDSPTVLRLKRSNFSYLR